MEYFQAKGLKPHLKGLTNGTAAIQNVCRTIIHVYSGARHQEILYLPYYCLKEIRRGGKTDYMLHGHTTKLNDGRPKATRWVTSVEASQAIHLAQKVASVIYRTLGSEPNENKVKVDEHPLFVSTSHLPFVPASPGTAARRFGIMADRRLDKLLTRLLPKIEEQDLRELEQIDPHRSWRSEPKYRPGKRWPLTDHQLRRSLALYAPNSGLVTLPSLRYQMQHITEAMSRYYAKGSQLAKRIIGSNKHHVGIEYQSAQPESQALAYIANVLFSDERLFGGSGNFLEHRKNANGAVRVVDDRDKTLKRFRKGDIAFKETMVGGCMNIEPCEKKAMRSIITCLRCKDAIIKPTKLNLVIAAQKSLVESLGHTTVEYRTELDDLQHLQAAKARIEEKAIKKEHKNVKSTE